MSNERQRSCGEIFCERLLDIASLELDWDGYGAGPPSPKTIALAKRAGEWMMEEFGLPHVVPVGDGSILLEWHGDGFDLELELRMSNERA